MPTKPAPVRTSSTRGCHRLPTITSTNPDEAHRIIGQARQRAPIAIGPYGPEALSYELVRTVLRDTRFTPARGLGLDVPRSGRSRSGGMGSPRLRRYPIEEAGTAAGNRTAACAYSTCAYKTDAPTRFAKTETTSARRTRRTLLWRLP